MKRLNSLDALRGVAALTIVFWHWQHFFAIRTGALLYDKPRSLQPFYAVFMPFYEQGWAAVDLFFPLSGFIFFWLYRQAIRERRMGPGRFALLRISRLYPLYLATLLTVAALQQIFRWRTGRFFIYETNDWWHFVSSLAMAQQWLPPNVSQSFNGPTWSISVEVLLYAIFFLVVRMGLGRPWQTLAIGLLGAWIYRYDYMIGRGLMGFFMGGTTFYLTERVIARPDAKRIARTVGVFAILAWLATIGELYLSPIDDFLRSIKDDGPSAVGQFLIWVDNDLYLYAFIFVVAPLTIMALALHEQVLGASYRRLTFLGDISYSAYLLHFPMQLALALVALRFSVEVQTFQTPFAMVSFFVMLIGISAISFNLFERPVQNWLRGLTSSGPIFTAKNDRVPQEIDVV